MIGLSSFNTQHPFEILRGGAAGLFAVRTLSTLDRAAE